MALILHLLASLFAWTAVEGQKCPPDWISPPDEVSCYKLVETKMSWFDAQNNCQSLGGHLLIVNSDEEFNWIISVTEANPYSQQWWIGLSMNENGTWTWVDGTESVIVGEENSSAGQGNHKEFCAVYDRDSQEISDENCGYKNFPVCEAEVESGSDCPGRWVKRQNSSSCYLLMLVSGLENGLAWNTARIYCRAMGGDLIVINSKYEKEWLSGAMEIYRHPKTWIGLSEKEGVWTWIDGTSLDTSILSWREGRPREHTGKNLDAIYIYEGGLRRTSVYGETGSVCEIATAPYTIACEAPPMSENQEVFCFSPDVTRVQCHDNLHVYGSYAIYRCKEPYQSTTGFPVAYSFCNFDQKWEAVPAFQCQ